MLVDPSKINISEKDIEDWLYENPSAIRGYSYPLTGWIGRQVHVPSGIIDLLGFVEFEGSYSVTVVEVKNVWHSQSAILQVCRYAQDIERAIQEFCFEGGNKWCQYVRKLVIAKGNVNTQLLQEADSVGVELISFDVNYSIKLMGSWRFSKDVYKNTSEEIEALAYKLFAAYPKVVNHADSLQS